MLAVDYRLLERLDAAARYRATSRTALAATWLAPKSLDRTPPSARLGRINWISQTLFAGHRAAVLMAAISSAHDGGSQKKRAPRGMPGARSFAVLMPPYCGGAAR